MGATPSSILLPANRIELVTKVKCATGIDVKSVQSARNTYPHGLVVQPAFSRAVVFDPCSGAATLHNA
jgi:hypothetical protein